jgi:hypothetical protein
MRKTHYLVTVECRDGEHEHYKSLIFDAKSDQEVDALEQLSADGTDAFDAPLGFRDGLTATRIQRYQPITDEQVEMLEELGVAYRI